MSTMYGANVDQLRQCAQQFDQQAQAVEGMARWLQHVLTDGWKGPDARQFHDQVHNSLAPDLTRVARAVREAAKDLRSQAQQQEQASAAHGPATGIPSTGPGRTTIAGPVSSTGHTADLIGLLRTVVTHGSNADTLAELAEFSDLIKIPKFLGPVSQVLGPAGSVFAALDIAEGVAEGDTGKVVGGIVDIGLGVASKTPAAPVVWGLMVGKALVDSSIPYSAESQDSLLDYQAQELFGRPRSELTPEQAVSLSNRYTGIGGVVSMLSDKMNQTAQPIDAAGRWFWRTVEAK